MPFASINKHEMNVTQYLWLSFAMSLREVTYLHIGLPHFLGPMVPGVQVV